jgi:hypothetical protein
LTKYQARQVVLFFKVSVEYERDEIPCRREEKRREEK